MTGTSCVTAPDIEILWQPIVITRTLDVVAAEALARDRRTNRVPDIGDPRIARYCLEQSVREARSVNCLDITASVNIEPWMLAILDEVVPSPKGLLFEITETGKIVRASKLSSKLRDLIDSEYFFAVDDWPDGSAPYHLRTLWRSVLVKIAKECFWHTTANNLRRIIEVLHGFAYAVALEGVENDEHLKKARESGADLVQGFHPLLGRPMPLDQFLKRFS